MISVFAGSTANNPFILSKGAGDTYGEFRVNGLSAGTESAGEISSLSAIVAYYPYDSNVTVKANEGVYTINATFPATQTYSASGTFGNGAAPAVAVTSSVFDANLKFKNVGSVIKVKLKGDATITKVVFSANADLAGKCSITASNKDVPTVEVTEASQAVTIDCGEGVKLSAETATTFVAAILPIARLEGGITVSYYDNNGKKMDYTYGADKVREIQRSVSYTMPEELTYEGAQEAEIVVKTADELRAIAEQVNEGTDYFEGKTIILANDIDLDGKEWTPIGSAAKDHGFMGNFDGKGYTIKNLTIENIALDSDGYAYAGLFGVTEGIDKDNQNYIKDFTIENVTISTTGHIASAAIAYPYYTVVENITVKGDIKIEGGDYTAGVLAYTRRCVAASNLAIEGNEGSSITGGQVVGGVISDIQTNGGLIADYSGFSASGLTISAKNKVGGISGIICKQTLDGATVKNVVLSGDAQVGVVSGAFGDVSTIKNVVTENVTGASDVIGATYKTNNPVQAKVGDTYYATLVDALATGESSDITLLYPVTVAAGEEVTLDLNGRTVSHEKKCTASYQMIYNKGTLTIKDNVGGGKISFKDTSAGDPNFGWGSYTIRNEGKLIVENGTIEHLGAQDKHMICAIFQYSGSTTINGGTISTPNYRSARLWKGDMTINGGEFDGQLWVQAVDNSASLTINGGTFGPNGGDGSSVFVTNDTYSVALAVNGGTFTTKIGCSDVTKEGVKGSVKGGVFTEAAKTGTNSKLIASGCEFVETGDGNWTLSKAVEVNGDTYTISSAAGMLWFAEQVNSGADYFEGKTIVLAGDIDLAGQEWTPIGSYTMAHGFMGNFDGQGYTIKNLKITDSKLTPDSDNYVYAGLFGVTEGIDKDNQNYIKDFTIENVTISTTGHIASAAIAYPYYTVVENITVKGDIKIEGGDYTAGVLAYTRRCVAASNLAIEGNEGSSITGGQVVGGVISDIQTNGGLIADYSGFSASGLTISAKNKVGGISGIICKQTLDGATVKNVVLSGDAQVGVVSGAFGDVSTIKNVVTENVTGASDVIGATYKTNNPVQAKVGDTYYETLVDALAKVQAGETITLLHDINSSEIIVINKDITLDGNGKTLTSTAGRAINVSGVAEATIKNLTINASGERAINIIQNSKKVIIDNVTATAANYTVNVAGSAPGVQVAISNSTLTGLNVVNVAGAGANVTVSNSTINCNDTNPTSGEDYAALTLNKDAVNGKITATDCTINVTEGSDSFPGNNGAEGGVVTINGSTDGVAVMVAYIVDSSYYYYAFPSLAAALEFAKPGQTVTLLRDVESSEILVINKNITLDGNGKTLKSTAGRAINVSGASKATIKNLTINASGERAINIIQNSKEVVIDNVTATAANYTVNVASSAPGVQVAISNSTLTGLNVVNVAGAGANVTVSNSTINCNDTSDIEGYAALCLNKDAVDGKIIATNCVVNVTGGSYKGSNGAKGGVVTINGSTEGVKSIVAIIDYGTNYYSFTTLKSALAKVEAGETIILQNDVELTEALVVEAGKNFTLDLNGKTISQKKAQTAAYGMIVNKGTLTIKDNVGGGKISYADVTAYTADVNYASNTITNYGTLNIESGIVENVTDDSVMNHSYPHAIDAYPGSTTNVKGGTVKSVNYDCIRLFCNSTTSATTVNISGGKIINRVSFQNPSSNAAGYGRLNITGGEFTTVGGVNANVRLLNFSQDVTNMKAEISGGTFDKGVKTQNYGSWTADWSWLTISNITINKL